MKYQISPLKLDEIKVVAKRLKSYLPEMKHMELLNVASYLVVGSKSIYEAQKQADEILKKHTITKNEGYESLGIIPEEPQIPTFKVRDWYFYPEDKVVAFHGGITPYIMELKNLNSSVKLLDFILQIQKKKWSKAQIKQHNISPTFQVDDFITLINNICLYYFDSSIQAVFSPFGQSKQINWAEAIKNKAIAQDEGEV